MCGCLHAMFLIFTQQLHECQLETNIRQSGSLTAMLDRWNNIDIRTAPDTNSSPTDIKSSGTGNNSSMFCINNSSPNIKSSSAGPKACHSDILIFSCHCAGATSRSNEGKLIGIIVGVVIACVIMLLVIVCCYWVHRRHYQAVDPAEGKADKAGGPEEDSVYINGLKVGESGGDKAAPDSPEHLEKMRKLEGMSFAKTKLSKAVASSPGAVGNSPGAIGAKGIAFADVTTPGRAEPFGSPIYTPRGNNRISQLFSTKSGHQVGQQSRPIYQHCMMLSALELSLSEYNV